MSTTAIKAEGAESPHAMWPLRPPSRLKAYVAIAALSFIAYIASRLTEGPESMAFAAFGVSACGWSWLLARALFDPAPRDAGWPRIVVTVLTLAGAVSVLAPDGVAATVAGNIYALSGSAALLLTFVEPFQRHGCVLSREEMRFRHAFVVVFTLLVGASVLGAWASPEPVEAICAAVGLVTAVIAAGFRLRRPLEAVVEPARPRAPRSATEDDVLLAARLSRLLQEEAIHTQPDLRIGDVAARLGQPEHRISRCISACLGFPNFNRLINHHRIEQARRDLAAPDRARSILDIALDCGFASIGPFNRAFKAETGMTPRDYRARLRD